MPITTHSISIILPAKNEAISLDSLLPRIRTSQPAAEIIVVSDGSTDDTVRVCNQHGVRVIQHPYSMGNGAAIKTGARHATGDILLFMDADGQHKPEDIKPLLAKLEERYDMIVGARHSSSQASLPRSLANRVYNWLASWMVGQRIEDLTSGFRTARADKFREFLHLLPNGFSYPTTITMAFFRAGYAVGYLPIVAERRIGKSHVQPMRDGARFFLIIFRIGALYSPLKLFLPISLASFVVGIGYYTYTFVTSGRFTNMSALLFTTSILIFLLGLVAEQITMLLYQTTRH
jgi:glycosyltransferase involved in cell wall biosynthesis